MTASSTIAAALPRLLAELRACARCPLPHGPRPVIHGTESARLLIISQAPGSKVHATGISFNDRSGDRLREWLGMDRATFYDERRVALMPMGFCYPGVDAHGGDLPPRRECAPHWHPLIRPAFRHVELTLLVGSYAQDFYLRDRRAKSMTETVARWRDYLPEIFVLPHPSWRNTGWLARNPWFEAEALPALRSRLTEILRA